MDRGIKTYNQVEATLGQASRAWEKIVGHIRFFYVMDELWTEGNPTGNYHSELKFRRGGKTLVTLYIREGFFKICLVLGKIEREKFEEQRVSFCKTIQKFYDDANTYHDGKWLWFDIHDEELINDIIRLLDIKRKPNRKREQLAIHEEYPCGVRCDLCLINVKNNENDFEGSKLFHGMDWRCYHDITNEERVDYSRTTCPGCNARKQECPTHKCLSEKGFSGCLGCGEHHTCEKNGNIINAGRCNIGLSHEDVTHCIIPYCSKERLDYWAKQ